MTVVGEAATGAQAAAMALRCDPDVVVMDLDMPDGDGLEATKAIVARGPRPRVLVLTMHTEEEHSLPVPQAGAAGYLVKNAADRELVDAIRSVAHGDVYVQQSAGRVLVHGLTRKTRQKPTANGTKGSARGSAMYFGSPLRAIRRRRLARSSPSAGRRSTPTSSASMRSLASPTARNTYALRFAWGYSRNSVAVRTAIAHPVDACRHPARRGAMLRLLTTRGPVASTVPVAV